MFAVCTRHITAVEFAPLAINGDVRFSEIHRVLLCRLHYRTAIIYLPVGGPDYRQRLTKRSRFIAHEQTISESLAAVKLWLLCDICFKLELSELELLMLQIRLT